MPYMSPLRFQHAVSARGAILVQVAVAIFVLIGLTAFVIDYGVVWLSRRQAQNAADAGALAGAVARAFDETTNPPSAGGPAEKSATLAAQTNKVFGQTPGVVVTWGCPSFESGRRCTQVDVYRDGTNGSATLPVFFARAFGGVTFQSVKATATAIVDVANASNCLRPWMIPDRFTGPDWQPPNQCVPLNKFDPTKGDVYTAPTSTSPGTGYRAMGTPNDIGCELVLKEGDPHNALSPSFYYEVTLDPNCPGGNCYRNEIESCVDLTKAIGQQLETLPGNRKGPTKQGVNALIALDPNATWNGTSVVSSCAPGCAPLSPRIVPVAAFSPQEFHDANRTSGRFWLTIVNIMGFFIESVDNSGNVTGRLIMDEGELLSGSTVGDKSGFNLVPVLVR